MRNNKERLGVHDQDSDETAQAVTQQQQSDNPVYTLPSPTELVSLPTEGKFYPPGHPLKDKENVEIYLMKTDHEAIINNKSLVEKGLVIDRLVAKLLYDSRIKPNSLFVVDKSAILIAARNSGYPDAYQTNIVCPSCGGQTPKEFDLMNRPVKQAPKGTSFTSEGTFHIDIPTDPRKPQDEKNPKWVTVECKLLTGEDEAAISFKEKKAKQHNLPYNPVKALLEQIIVGVNDNQDPEVVKKFVGDMYAMHAKHLRFEYERIAPNVDLDFAFDCPRCGDSNTVRIPLNANFFWSNRRVPKVRS